jgi:uncharacterized protein YhfF
MSSPEEIWKKYLQSINEDPFKTKLKYELIDHFCSEKEPADRLYKLAESGIKRATTGSIEICKYHNEPLLKPGDLSILTNFDQSECCVIRTVKSTIKHFSEINEEDAFIEGEGDKSLAYWRNAHLDYFSEEYKRVGLSFSESILVVFEEFEVAYRDN